MQLKDRIVKDGLRPPAPSDPRMPAEYLRLIRRCWQLDPAARPSFDEIVKVL